MLEQIKQILMDNLSWVLLIQSGTIVLLVLILIIVFIREHRLHRRMNLFMRSADGEPLERSLRRVVDDNKRVMLEVKTNREDIEKIKMDLSTAYRKIGIVKYNAFPGMAGKMSSCVALLNNENNGYIVNSMHGPDGCYTYVREIMNGKSINPLTKEDEEALSRALEIEELN